MKIVKWALATGVVLALVMWGGSKWRPSASTSPPTSASKATQTDHIEVAATDVVPLKEQTLAEGVPVSGTLRAVQSAWVKARVAGELQGFSLREGDGVKAGQIIGRIDPTEFERRLRQSQEQAEAAKAQVDIAQKQYDNNNALVQQGFISKTALDTSLFNLQSAQATLRAAQAGADVARKSLEDSVLKAPISGWVSSRGAQNGERLAIDTKVLEIVDLSQLELEASLSPADAARVRVGQMARLQIEGLNGSVPAQVSRINPNVQSGSRNVLAYLKVTPQPGMRQGLFAQGQIGASETRALALPLSTLRTDQSVPYVQWVNTGLVNHTQVKVGVRGPLVSEPDGETWVQVEGLPAGSNVLAGHLGRLREGLSVRTTASKGN
ncbi:MAG: efflux RND transporter periplasmic adaptor subunit [Alphaproteobacteria bacterium]|nr:efflux RND transporter periplasmic adaptor subunit [Alphaproteobacteria bacterium]